MNLLNPISQLQTSSKHLILVIFCCISIAESFGQISLEFSHERGFYSSAISVVLSSPESPNATIRYTTNNTKPSPTNGLIYNGPINISQTRSIRAVASSALGSSKVITQTYIFLDEITSQGYMSNHVPNDAQLDLALLSLPTISVVSDNIFPGVHVDVETEVSLEMFFPNGDKDFMLHCGSQTWGGSDLNPKLAYRFEFKNAYGDKKLDFDVFNSDDYETHEYKIPPRLEFDKILLRTGSQDGLNAEFGNENNTQFIRNRFMMDVSMELGFPEAHGRYVHVYVNQRYQGQYHLMERPDASWFETYLGGNKDDYEVRRGVGNYWDGYTGGGEGPAHTAMTNNINLGSAAGIANTNQYINLKSAANYMVMMGYLSGFDWSDSHNALCGGHQTPGVTPYMFPLWDVDLGLGQGGKWHPNFSGDVNYFTAPFSSDGPLPPGLVGNSEFNMMMADALHCACFDDGPLTQANADSLYLERAQQIENSVIAEAARWGNVTFTGNGNIDVPQWDKSDWLSELNYMRNTYLPQRRINLINHFKSNNAYPSIDGVNYSDDGGQFASGYQLSLSNPNGSGTLFYTTDGSDPRTFGGGVSPSALAYSGPITLPTGVYEVKARIRNSSGWSAMCPKKFYIGQEYTNIRINEIHYNPEDSIINGATISGTKFEFIELKNRGNTDVDMTDVIFDKGVTIFFPEGLIIPAGGFLVLADNALHFQQKYGFAPDLVWEGKLSNGGEELRYVGPDKKTIDKVTYDDDFPWDPLPDVGKYSLGCIDIHVTNNSSVNWSEQTVYYTPGAENIFAPNIKPDYSGIVINEIHYHPNDYFHVGPDTLVPSKEFEFVEIKNNSNGVVFMADLEFVEGINYKFDDDVFLAPNSFIVLAEDSMWFHQRYGFAPFDKYDGKLENDSDTIVLYDVFNRLVDSVAYFDSFPWDNLPDLGDYSLGLIDPDLDHNKALNWSHQCDFVTPNAENVFCADAYPDYSGLVINEIHYDPGVGNSVEFIEIKNTSTIPILMDDIILSGGVSYAFPPGIIVPAGGFIVLANNMTFFQSAYGLTATGEFNGDLSNVSATLELTDFFGNQVDIVNYGSTSPWATAPASGSFSLALVDSAFDNDISVNWSEQNVSTTPFAENTFGANGGLPMYQDLVINEIHYNPGDSIIPLGGVIPGNIFDFIELKNIGNSDINLSGTNFTAGIDYSFVEGDVIPAGGFIVLATNASWFQTRHGVPPTGVYTGTLSNGGELLRMTSFFGTTVDQLTYDDTKPWDADADGGIYSLALIDADLDNASPLNWSIQDVLYSPFSENTFGPNAFDNYAGLEINELHYDSQLGANYEFIELKNNSANDICLDGLSFAQGVSFVFSSTDIIPAGGFFVIAGNASSFQTFYQQTADGVYNGSLSNVGETVKIIDFFGATVDQVSYSSVAPWDPEASLGQYSLALRLGGVNNTLPQSWGIQLPFYTPSAENVFDADGDGVADSQDLCPGFDDNLDTNNNGIPDDCDIACPDYIIENTQTNITVNQIAKIAIETDGKVMSTADVIYQAGESIEMQPEFEVLPGAIFHAKIDGCN